jgi:hypothetical protein
MIKAQAPPGVLVPFFFSEVHRLSRGQQNKGKMIDSETLPKVEYGCEDFPQYQI